MVTLIALLALQEEPKNYWPVAKDSKWEFASGEQELSLRVDGTEEIEIHRGGRAKAWVLLGFAKEKAWLVERERGIQIVERRHIGYAGSPANVIVADLRWGKEETWTFPTAEGCLVSDVKCSKSEENGLLKITAGDDVSWLKDGLVKFTRARLTWERKK